MKQETTVSVSNLLVSGDSSSLSPGVYSDHPEAWNCQQPSAGEGEMGMIPTRI